MYISIGTFHNKDERNDFMNTVPNMISTKDLSYISDMINWNITAGKSAHHFANECQLEDVKKMMEVVRDMHAKHLAMLIDILKEGQYE